MSLNRFKALSLKDKHDASMERVPKKEAKKERAKRMTKGRKVTSKSK